MQVGLLPLCVNMSESQRLLITQSVCAAMDDTDRVVQFLYESQRDVAFWLAANADATSAPTALGADRSVTTGPPCLACPAPCGMPVRKAVLWRRLESTGGSFPAACHEFVIPAEVGIQKARLDSPVSSTGQACHARNDGPEQKKPPACRRVVHLKIGQ